MSTTHSQHTQHTPIRPPASLSARCLRHRVWMAACGDCREAHREQPARPSGPAA